MKTARRAIDGFGVTAIGAERARHTLTKPFTSAHDDKHESGELCDAAICYARAAAKQARGESLEYLRHMATSGEIRWPWEDMWWKPSEDQIRNLVKAGALIAAEIDRLQRIRINRRKKK